jgi:hypothetical protein
MLLKELMTQSSLYFAKENRRVEKPLSWNVFRQGGAWMRAWLMEWDHVRKWNTEPVDFNSYGWCKYLICMAAFLGSASVFYVINPWLLPLSLLVFYIAEVHFLFLFPLLIDGVRRPLWQSIVITHRIGLWRVLAKVIPIGVFMMVGLFHFSDPFRNWYKGCLAVLIWYQHEVRDRI